MYEGARSAVTPPSDCLSEGNRRIICWSMNRCMQQHTRLPSPDFCNFWKEKKSRDSWSVCLIPSCSSTGQRLSRPLVCKHCKASANLLFLVKAIEVSHDRPRPVFSSLLSLPQKWVPHLEVSWLVNTIGLHTWRRGAVVMEQSWLKMNRPPVWFNPGCMETIMEWIATLEVNC